MPRIIIKVKKVYKFERYVTKQNINKLDLLRNRNGHSNLYCEKYHNRENHDPNKILLFFGFGFIKAFLNVSFYCLSNCMNYYYNS